MASELPMEGPRLPVPPPLEWAAEASEAKCYSSGCPGFSLTHTQRTAQLRAQGFAAGPCEI